jgi:alanyl aminopeptidase
MAPKAVDAWQPGWDSGVLDTADRLAAMNSDSLVAARKIRQPVEDPRDVPNAFDNITYGKASAVIHMFEQSLGADVFRKGVKAYLDAHAHGNATAADFLAALGTAAGRPVAPAFTSFLDQAGLPQVSVALKCSAGRAPSLSLAQKRYLPLGSPRPAPQTWQIPICYRYRAAGATGRGCVTLTEPAVEAPIAAAGCPDAVLLNAGYDGYFRSDYGGGLRESLLRDPAGLEPSERLGFVSDALALAKSTELPYAEALALAPRFAGDPKRPVVAATMDIVQSVEGYLVPDDQRARYVRFVQETYGAPARALGWTPQPGDDEDTKLLRPSIVGLVAGPGEDQTLRAQAALLARKWLDDRAAVAPDVLGTVLAVAAREGGRDLWERFLGEARKTSDQREREALFAAMGSFRDPALLERGFDLIVRQQVDMREAFGLLFAPLSYRDTRDLPYRYIVAHYDAVAAAMPAFAAFDGRSLLAYAAGGFCSDEGGKDVQAFFAERSAKVPGGARILAQVVEGIGQCAALRAAQQASVRGFLERY